MDPEQKSLNFIFPTKYVIPKSLSSLAIGQVSKPTSKKLWLDFQGRAFWERQIH